MNVSRLDDPLVVSAAERIARGSKSFALAARLFAPETRADAFLLYAWCRHCDDEIDGQVLGYARTHPRGPSDEVLARLRADTMAATAGTATEPVFVGLQRVTARHAIPALYPMDLIRGMEMDVAHDAGRHRYATTEQLLAYCYHVAGVVGVMMAYVMGQRDPAVLTRASDLGIAFQLTNIARDVTADAAAGRVYLPDDRLAPLGLTSQTVADPARRQSLADVVASLLDLADQYYASAALGVAYLPFRSAWAVAAARRVYRGIGSEVRRRGPAAWDARSSTGTLAKLTGVALAAGDAVRASRVGDARATSREGLWTPPSLRPGVDQALP